MTAVVLDTSLMVEAFSGEGRLLPAVTEAVRRGERMLLPTMVLYEWLRGPRRPAELALQREMMPSEEALPFGPEEAACAAELYRTVPRPRGRELDLAIAAHTVVRGAELWTLNARDFSDLPGLELYSP